MSKRKLSSLSFSERAYSGLRFSASFCNLRSISAAAGGFSSTRELSGSMSPACASAKNPFRFRKSSSSGAKPCLYKRNTFGSIWDLRGSAYTGYRVSGPAACERPSKARPHPIRLLKAQSLKQFDSLTANDDDGRTFRRLKLFWKQRCKVKTGTKMLEDSSRRARIIMPWGTASLEVPIEYKTLTCDLLDTVASKCKLVERNYFGLAYKDRATNQLNWLQSDKRVLEHDLPKTGSPLVLHFAVRFFVDTYARLQTTTAVELMYLQSKEHIFKGDLICSDEDAFKLAALVLQETCGDYTDDESTKKVISKYPLMPSFVLQKHLSITFCEERILMYYKSLKTNTRGIVIVGFLSIVESLPSYGTHYYCVKDKEGMPWWLGISRHGIAVYDFNDRSRPRRLFKWEAIENIFYRDKKFCLEIFNSRRVSSKADGSNLYSDAVRDGDASHDELTAAMSDPTTQVSISKRVYGPSTIDVHQWVCSSAQATESMWHMAVGQHRFSVEMALRSSNSNNNSSSSSSCYGDLRPNEEIVRELNCSAPLFSEAGWTDHSRPATDLALDTKRILSSLPADAEVLEKAKQQLKILKEKKLILNDNLSSKMRELKRLCLEEANLIGELPKEYPLEEGEVLPRIKKRIGTSYSLNIGGVSGAGGGGFSETPEEMLAYEIQDKITKAALVLAQEEKIPKNIRKSRIESYHREWKKLKSMESSLKQMTKSRKPKDDASRKLRSMAEPTRSSQMAVVELKNRRSLEALPTSASSEEQSKGRINSLKQEHQNSSRRHLVLSRASNSCHSSTSHKSAPSSPTLPRFPAPTPVLDRQQSIYVHPLSHQRVYDEGRIPVELQRQASSASNDIMHSSRHHHHHHHPDCHRNLMAHQCPSYYDYSGNHHHHPTTSFVIPLSADPRITSRNFAAGYGLLTCKEDQLPKRWGSDAGSGFSARYRAHLVDPRCTPGQELVRALSGVHLADGPGRCRSDSSSTLSSSSGGGTGGSTHSCNKLFSKSSAYPTPLQVGSLHQVASGEFLNSSSSSMSSSTNYEHHQFSTDTSSYLSYSSWSDPQSLKGYEACQERAPSSSDSGYEASTRQAPFGVGLHSGTYKREISKPFETSDVAKYSEGRRVVVARPLDPRRHPTGPDFCGGSFGSNSSAGSSSSLYGGSKNVTLTRENIGGFHPRSRSRRPILGGSDASMDALCDGDDGRQGCYDLQEIGRESAFNSFRLETDVSQEFEAEMLQWYDTCGAAPQPDDKFTLV